MGDPLVVSAAKGAVGGAVGTRCMSAVMLAAQRAGLLSKQPPETLTEAALDEAGLEALRSRAHGLERARPARSRTVPALSGPIATRLALPIGRLGTGIGTALPPVISSEAKQTWRLPDPGGAHPR